MALHSSYESQIQDLQEEYVKKGHQEALSNRPTTDSTNMDKNESELYAKAEKFVNTEIHLFSAVINSTNTAIQDLEQKIVTLKTKTDQILGETSIDVAIKMDLASERNELIAATEKYMLTELDWKYFRARNSITEQAVYPDSHIWHFALIMLLAFVETITNAFFYENSQGLLGGFVVALGVAVINMFFALLLGSGFRFKNLVDLKNKIIGWVCFALFAYLSIYCNALFASFRSQYQLLTDPSDAQQVSHAFKLAALEANKIFVYEFQFLDLMSFILFGFGVVLSIIAFYKGYTFDDKYPGYGHLDRLLKKARNIKNAKQADVTSKVKEYLIRKRGDVQAAINEPTILINLASYRVSDLAHALSSMQSRVKSIQLDFSTVLQNYRKANLAVRVTPAPNYFNEIPDLIIKIKDINSEPLIEHLMSLKESIESLRLAHQEQLNIKLRSLESESANVLTDLLPRFFNSVEDEAHVKITKAANP